MYQNESWYFVYLTASIPDEEELRQDRCACGGSRRQVFDLPKPKLEVIEYQYIVTRLRKDARLRYLYHGPKRHGKGRSKKYDGRIDIRNLRLDQVVPCAQAEDGSWIAYELVANVQAWKRNAKIVIVHELKADGRSKVLESSRVPIYKWMVQAYF